MPDITVSSDIDSFMQSANRQAAMDNLAGATTSGQYLRGNGSDVVMSAIQAADVPTLNQNTTGTAAGLSATLAETSGGTGETSYTNGQLLIGNAAGGLTKATLTAGSNVTVTNGDGAITIAATGGSATPTNVQVFTSSGTWTKPAGAVSVDVFVISAGGGGASGRKGGAGSAAPGGGGGGGGSYSARTFSAALLGATETVTVGAKGLGGASVTVNATNGNAGTAGTNSSFGGWVIVQGGGGAGIVTTASGPAGASASARAMFQGGNGGTGGTGAGAGGNNATVGCPGGGSGGGLVAVTPTAANGGVGGVALGTFASGGQATGGLAGGGNGGTGSNSFVNTAIAGSAGAGGGSSITVGVNGGNGGNGGFYGAAGGGGGAGLDSTNNSGAGGDGADGIVIVTTYF